VKHAIKHEERRKRIRERLSMELLDEVAGHSPLTILVHHGSDRLYARFLVLEGSFKLDHHVFSVRSAGKGGVIALAFPPVQAVTNLGKFLYSVTIFVHFLPFLPKPPS
jgi:hypothetical protein